jgi:hypothetical protein
VYQGYVSKTTIKSDEDKYHHDEIREIPESSGRGHEYADFEDFKNEGVEGEKKDEAGR